MLDPATLAADAASLIEALADVTVTWTPAGGGGPYSTPAIRHAPDIDVLSGEVLSRDWRIHYPTAALPGLADRWDDEVLVIDGATWRLRSVRRLGDGLIAEAALTQL